MTSNSRPRPGTAPSEGGGAPSCLSPRQARAIPFLAAAASVKRGCETAGIGLRTYRTWSTQPAFRAALSNARDALTRDAFDRLRAGLGRAVDGLIELAESATQEAVRVSACRAVLEHVVRIEEVKALEARIAALEQRLPQRGGRG